MVDHDDERAGFVRVRPGGLPDALVGEKVERAHPVLLDIILVCSVIVRCLQTAVEVSLRAILAETRKILKNLRASFIIFIFFLIYFN